MWTPPTPPQDDHDLYIDQCVSFLYEPSVMPESQLPPVYVKKEHKRIRVDPAMTRKIKVRKEEQPRVPRSLFNRPMSALRRDASKLVKLKHHALLKPFKPQPLSAVNRPLMDTTHDQPEWLIHEDWALLQVVQTLLGLPLNLTTSSPAHIPNWDLVAEVVNATSHTYISAKQCKYRYENVIVPREEGRILYDINPRKQKKSKGIYKTKNNRPMRTSQLFLQDNHASLTKQHSDRFEACKAIAAKRTPTLRPTLANPMLKNPKHAAVLAESGINYEQPLSPIQVAANRADRIAKEKRQNVSIVSCDHFS
ncbi:hypothetical protein NP493_12g07040 [Ridgeia piscesae]|uniref:Myb-like domain-containing protein n=1 Tax=Ridgeia piscesae TaxID=27915 RepID=A0AAD9PF92_RIDPI|nr:hypothetical protein NP493_12g07040 [Ridgeia piscesae]